jgi:hypothetical protein
MGCALVSNAGHTCLLLVSTRCAPVPVCQWVQEEVLEDVKYSHSCWFDVL